MPEETNLSMNTETTDTFWDTDMDDAFDGAPAPEPTVDETKPEPTPDGENHDDKADDKAEPRNEPAAPETVQAVKVKYNGQEMELPLEQAIPLIQKGMNYDHVNEQLTALKNAPERQMIAQLAKQSGKTTEEYMRDVTAAMDAQQVRNVMANNPGMTKEVAQQMLEKDKQLKQAQAELEGVKAKVTQAQPQIMRNEMLREFFVNHADLSPKDIPQEVLKAVSEGKDMETAYVSYQNKQLAAQLDALKAQLAAEQTNKANQQKAVGAVGNAAPEPEHDDLWDAFMKG